MYQLNCDCVCYPILLADDTTPEAIPYPWTEAIKYYAAMLAYRDAQRSDDAEKMNKEYTATMTEARAISEPAFVPDYYQSDF